MTSAVPSPSQIASKTCFAIFPEIVWSQIRLISIPNSSAETGLSKIGKFAVFKRLINSPIVQFAAWFAFSDVIATVSKYSDSSLVAASK